MDELFKMAGMELPDYLKGSLQSEETTKKIEESEIVKPESETKIIVKKEDEKPQKPKEDKSSEV